MPEISLVVMPDIFQPLILILASRKGPTVGVLSKSTIFPSIPSFSPAACVFGIKKDALIVCGSAGIRCGGELLGATGPVMLSTFLVTCGHAGECLGVRGCGDIWDGFEVSLSTISTCAKIPL